MYQGYGLAADVWGPNYDGWIGAGYQERWRLGGFVRFRATNDTLKLGNDLLTFRLPTDVFGDAYHVLVQGLTLQSGRGRSHVVVFGGASSTGLGVPLFAARHADQSFAAMLVDDSLTARLHIGGSALIAHHPTTIGNIEWRGGDGSSVAVSSGIGAGQPYYAVSGAIFRDMWEAKTSLIESKQGFRRVALPIPAQTSLDGINVELSLHPTDWGFLALARHEYVSDSGPAIGIVHANGTSAVVGLMNEDAHVATGVYLSHSPSGRNVSAYVAAGWRVNDWFGADAYALQSRFNNGKPKTTPAFMAHERVSQRLTLDEVLTGFGAGASLGVGGSYIGRFGEYSLSYQIVNDPFDAQQPFKRTVNLATRLQLGDYSASIGSSMTPNGTVTYTASAERYLYLGGDNGAAPSPLRIRMDRYIVEGIVRDDQGEPVAGAAVALDGEIVFTDSRGRFFARVPRNRPVALAVRLDQFLTLGTFTVVSAPSTVVPDVEGKTTPVVIVLQRH